MDWWNEGLVEDAGGLYTEILSPLSDTTSRVTRIPPKS